MHHARQLPVSDLNEAALPPHVAEALLAEAETAAGLSYSPYSQFAVGAALLDAKGNVWRGCNVEIANYGLTVCAEQTALHTAVCGRGSVGSANGGAWHYAVWVV
jgi:cytidine deaminase